MVGRHILEDIVERVAQYVDAEHYPVDKWHLGDLMAWVAQSALKYRPRICELSKCLEGPLKMIVCPKKLLPTLSHLVKLLYAARDDKCRIGPLAGAPPDTCAVVISTETESGFITEDDTSPVCHTPSCPRSAKIQSTLPMMWGQWNVGSSSQLRSVASLWFLLMALDVWKEVSGVESMLALLMPKWPLF
ncbi:hypothetical protein TNCV_450111 [Trichonephila clavipes]|nr:hypothetical protein TNCV_450111 [Trichonephila clavipes]